MSMLIKYIYTNVSLKLSHIDWLSHFTLFASFAYVPYSQYKMMKYFMLIIKKWMVTMETLFAIQIMLFLPKKWVILTVKDTDMYLDWN